MCLSVMFIHIYGIVRSFRDELTKIIKTVETAEYIVLLFEPKQKQNKKHLFLYEKCHFAANFIYVAHSHRNSHSVNASDIIVVAWSCLYLL